MGCTVQGSRTPCALQPRVSIVGNASLALKDVSAYVNNVVCSLTEEGPESAIVYPFEHGPGPHAYVVSKSLILLNLGLLPR